MGVQLSFKVWLTVWCSKILFAINYITTELLEPQVLNPGLFQYDLFVGNIYISQ